MANLLAVALLFSYPDPGYHTPIPRRPVMACPAPYMSCDSFNLARSYTRPSPLIYPDATGWWLQYAQSPTDAQIWYHGYEDEQVDGFIAVMDCDRVGSYAWITVNNSSWQRVRVFDCMGRDGNPSWWKENYIIGELGYYLAQEHGVVGRGGVKARIAWE